MSLTLDPFRHLLISLASWWNQHQRDVIAYHEEKNRALREQLGNKRLLRTNDDQRRRLAVKAQKLGGFRNLRPWSHRRRSWLGTVS